MNVTQMVASVFYRTSDETPRIYQKAKDCGMLIRSRGRREVLCFSHVSIDELERVLLESNIPYDIIRYAEIFNLPRVKKVRPQENYVKEMPCLLYVGEEDEQGVLTASRLREILDGPEKNLKSLLQKELKEITFHCGDLVG